ncbi:zinc finger CCCH domain-containing protein 20 [Phtheirospermum japonicum]|uniref:Zinc finger CCCH domain-containing protein 20 n=1 Tax=Phtheirospermum japonicum TaxID=374723 RepID=A0A830CN21_9LAMI|nr:zinc finger CCCH domain-containing protein 20 [Phtheirospermum japonicum]
MADDYSLFFQTDSLKALQRYLQSNSNDAAAESDFLSVDAHSCDHFRMFDFKVRKCTRGRSHDWTECPFAHPGEKARRRDPKKFHYSAAACPDFRKGNCRKADACEFSHGVFECWLHPARYRTQPCKDGMNCKRRVCFFAHSPDQLRILSPRLDRHAFVSPPPESVSPPADSPPLTPTAVNEMVATLRHLHLNKVMSMPSSWPGACSSPRLKMSPTGYLSLPTTPTRPVYRPGLGYFDAWDSAQREEEEEPMVMVESGRDLRAKMFEKLSKENPLDRADPNPNPDVGWVSELLK